MYALCIIDDEAEQLDGLASYYPWGQDGFSVSATFTNGRDALAWFETHNADAVLTDIKMPFITGLDVIKTLTEKGNPPLFCIMSAYDDFAFAKEAIHYGVQDYLVKPASFAEIHEAFLRLKEKLDKKKVIIPPSPLSHDENPLIAEALAIITKRPGEITLQSLADTLGINISYLSRLFKEKTGTNFQEYLLKTKMETAKVMLSGTAEYTNKDIAKALGYQDTQNFCRTFKKNVGKTPGSYRENTKNR